MPAFCLFCKEESDNLLNHIKNEHLNNYTTKYKCQHCDFYSFIPEKMKQHQKKNKSHKIDAINLEVLNKYYVDYICKIVNKDSVFASTHGEQHLEKSVQNTLRNLSSSTSSTSSSTMDKDKTEEIVKSSNVPGAPAAAAASSSTQIQPASHSRTKQVTFVEPLSAANSQNIEPEIGAHTSSSTRKSVLTRQKTQMLFSSTMKEVDALAKYKTFEEMVGKSNFISDKSMFIREFAEGHLLFWLPPGRGKTMLLTMLFAFYKLPQQKPMLADDYFFEDGNNVPEYRFQIMDDIEMMDNAKGKYPVIYISFADLSATTLDNLFTEMSKRICRAFHDHVCGKDECDETFKAENFYHACDDDEAIEKAKNVRDNWVHGLASLAKILIERHKCEKKAIVLIDDYDEPLQQAIFLNKYNYLEELDINLLEQFIGTLIKTTMEDKNVERVILMGNYRLKCTTKLIQKAYGPSQLKYGPYFYFTKMEFHQLCEHYRTDNKTREAAELYYNGYPGTDREGLFQMYSTGSFFNNIKGRQRQSMISTSSSINSILKLDCHYDEPNMIEHFRTIFLKKEIVYIIKKLAKGKSHCISLGGHNGEYLVDDIKDLNAINAAIRGVFDDKMNENISLVSAFLRLLRANGCIIPSNKNERSYIVPNEEMRDLLTSKIKHFLKRIYGFDLDLIKNVSDELFEILRIDIDGKQQMETGRLEALESALVELVKHLPGVFADIHQFSKEMDEKDPRIIRANEHIIHSLIDVASLCMPQFDDKSWQRFGSDFKFGPYHWETNFDKITNYEEVEEEDEEEDIATARVNKTDNRPDIVFVRTDGQLGIIIELKYNHLSKTGNDEKHMWDMGDIFTQITEQKYLRYFATFDNVKLKKLIAIAITVEKWSKKAEPFAFAVMATKNRGTNEPLQHFIEEFEKELPHVLRPEPKKKQPDRAAKSLHVQQTAGQGRQTAAGQEQQTAGQVRKLSKFFESKSKQNK